MADALFVAGALLGIDVEEEPETCIVVIILSNAGFFGIFTGVLLIIGSKNLIWSRIGGTFQYKACGASSLLRTYVW